MDRIIQSPGKYIQGAGAIKRLGDYLKPLAERWLVVGDKFVLGFAEEMLRKSLADAGLAAEIAPFGGECSHNEINRLRDIAGNAKCTAVLGIGGGKTLDTAKALAHFMNVPVAIAPTIASTDAPCSALSVIYTDEGEFDSYLMLPRNPNMVIVDTQIVAGAPARLLAAGADMNRVLCLTADDYFQRTGQPLTLKDEALAKFAAKAGPLLLIVDPLQSFLPAGVEMASRNQMRSILLPLKAIAAAQRCAVLLVMHSNKKQGVSDRKRLADSSDIWDMARSVLMMGRSNSDGKIYLSHEKSSYSRPQQTVLLHIEDVELDGVRTAQAVFDGYTDKKDADFIKEPRVRQAQTKEDTRDAILNVLAESRLGSMASPQLKSEVMREIGCSEGTYNRAYGELVKSHTIAKYQLNQKGGVRGWFTRLPYRSEADDKVTYI